ncbi:CcdB family protein [Mangrovibacter phragmitis]|uniref:CcdB family protein n=1 Tax=Mangrovibacter phragmitis TaxID=1691903 RepID=UPI00336A625F
MAQYAVYVNRSPKTRQQYPFIIDIQSDLLDEYDSRVVMPLAPMTAQNSQIRSLTPVISVSGQRYVVIVKSVTTVSKDKLKEADVVAVVPEIHADILSGLHGIVSGI